jgi:hypothetical protein
MLCNLLYTNKSIYFRCYHREGSTNFPVKSAQGEIRTRIC